MNCIRLITLLWSLTLYAQTWADTSVSFIHLNDIYEIQPVEGGKYGGLARVATEVDRLRKTMAPAIVTLGGDYLSPSALGTAKVDGNALAGRQMVDVLNLVGIDWATFGNHEFDVPEVAFRHHLELVKYRLLSSNVVDAEGKPFPGVATSAIAKVKTGKQTLRIGLIGVTLNATAARWVGFRDAIAAAGEKVAEMRGRVDAVVALTHLTLAQDGEFLAALPEIDLVLGGHEHENWLMRRGPRLVPIVKADANARSLAVATLHFAGPGKRPSVDVRLVPIDASIREKPAVAARVVHWTELAFAGFRQEGFEPDKVVANISEPLDGRESVVRNRAGRLTDLIVSAMAREAAPADVALFSGGSVRIDDVLPAGPLSEYDIIRVLPFGGRIVAATLEGALLGRVLEMGENNQGLGGYLHSWGTERRSDGWHVGGKLLDPAARYRVALTDFLLTGGEVNLGFLTRDNPQVQDVRELRDVRRVLIDELKATYR